ncbi:MAG: amidohydrolase family protein [Fuerstiella sp.]|nr:amidohydrolase family protein [Fuerstiella sp.]
MTESVSGKLCVTWLVWGCVLSSVGGGEFPGRNWKQLSSPSDAGWSVDQLITAREFSEAQATAAVMIVESGRVIDQWGPVGLPLKCHSIRKSLLSGLYGAHVDTGRIDINHTMQQLGINDNEPSLTVPERQARIRDLLTARSGVYHPALYETAAMAAARPQRGSHAANTFWYYNNWDFNVSGSIFENLTGRSIFEEFENHVAKPIGLEDFHRERHTRYVTGDDSVHAAYPFELSTRDLARFGLLFLRHGKWKDQQLIPRKWVQESTSSYSDAGASGGYGYMWWVAVDGRHFPGVSLPDGTYSARGYRGQYLLVIPEWDLLICHRVNTFQQGTSVSKTEFGKLLSLILAARPSAPASNAFQTPRSVRAEQPNVDTDSVRYDLIIRNAEVIDGTGRPRYRADIAVLNGVITEIGDLPDAEASRVIDATDRLLAPGFIDLHSHAEQGLVDHDPARRSAPNLITQGITTVVVNQDGGGPLNLTVQRQTMEQLGIGMNVVPVAGHGTIRREVMGRDHQRPASADELERMQQLLRKSLKQGAFGMSAGLEYVPGRWSTPREMEALAETIAASNGVYIVHERSSGSRPMWFLPSRDSADQPSMLDNLKELIQIAATTNVTTVATHIKARGTDFWGSSRKMNELIRRARDDGLPFYADQYPYNTSGSDGRIVLIPAWASSKQAATNTDTDNTVSPADMLEKIMTNDSLAANVRRDIEYEIIRRGGADRILIVEHPDTDSVGKTLGELAMRTKSTIVEAAISLQLNGDRNRRGGARLRAFSMSEEDVESFAATPWTATSSDAGIALPGDGPVHPRFYGAFPRKIRHYAIDRGLMSTEEAVRVSTSLPAGILNLTNRGVIRKGAHADLVVFDPIRIRDKADAFQPHRYSEGIEYVLVNGKLAVDREQWTGNLSGRVLSRTQSAATTIPP